MTIREWIDIQADVFSVSEQNDPGAWEKQVNLENAKRRVKAMREAESGNS